MQANEDRVDAEGPMMNILLPARARRLLQALGLEGWSHRAYELRKLLGSCPLTQFKLHLHSMVEEAEPRPTKGESKRGAGAESAVRADISATEFKPWFDARLVSVVDALVRVGLALVHDLPSGLLPSSATANAEAAMRAAQELVEAAAKLSPKALIASCSSGVPLQGGDGEGEGEPHDQAAAFRSAWAELLAALSAPVHHLVPSNVTRSEYLLLRLCLSHARIVFCTVSSAGRGIMRVGSAAGLLRSGELQ